MKKLVSLITLLTLLQSMSCLAQNPGSLDNSFNVGLGPQYLNGGYLTTAIIRHSTLLPDGKIMVLGRFKYFDGNTTSKIARLNANGSFDYTFNSSGTGFDSNLPWNSEAVPDEIFAQPDGKILVSGSFKNYNGIAKRLLIRLNADGSLDNSFYFYNTPLSEYNTYQNKIDDIYVMSNGKILVSGVFGYYNNAILTVKYQLLRINSDGSLDTTFNIQHSYDGQIENIKLQADGKILVAGGFNNIDDFLYPKIARLNSDGSVDTTFIINAGFNNTVLQLEIAPDGSIFAGGSFTTFDNAPVKRIIKLLPGGNRDFSFSINESEIAFFQAGPSLTSQNFVLRDNGQVFLFDHAYINGVWNWNVGMFNADGSYDSSFINGFTNFVNGGFIQPDGKIVCFGEFSTYNGQLVNRIIRINAPSLSTNDFNQIKATVYPNPSSSEIHITGFPNDDLIDLLIITDMTGKEILRHTKVTNKINIKNLASGMYLLKISSNNKVSNTKFIKK